MPFLVTAFGPFGGRQHNASSLALRELKTSMPEIHARILPVDSVRAPAIIRQAILRSRPKALIMLGEAAGSQTIRLETTAWNEKDFRLPDIAGRQPRRLPINPCGTESLPSSLPLQPIFQTLQNQGIPVSLSNDAGRYLCNQLFFAALDFLKSKSIGIPAGFIHLPLESSFPPDRSAAAIASAIQTIKSSS